MVFPLPMDYESSSTAVFVAGKTEGPNRETEPVWSSRADPGYFATMGTAIVAGREFTAQDDSSAPAVVIINEAMARRYWPGDDAVGREMRVGGRTGKVLRVIGVARDGKYIFLGEQATPAMWTALRQRYSPGWSSSCTRRATRRPSSRRCARRSGEWIRMSRSSARRRSRCI